MQVETRFIRIRKQVEPGDEVEGQPVCWVGGWDKARVFYLVMVIVTEADGNHRAANHNRKSVSATTVNHG